MLAITRHPLENFTLSYKDMTVLMRAIELSKSGNPNYPVTSVEIQIELNGLWMAMSLRYEQGISFMMAPGVYATVTYLGCASGRRFRFGIEAPREVAVLRDDAVADMQSLTPPDGSEAAA
jgi:hypothetical protein